MKARLCIFFCLIASLAKGEEFRAVDPMQNFYEAVKQPKEPLDFRTRSVLDQLAKSRVPTAREAEKLALQELIQKGGGGLDARENWATTGLYRLAPVGKSSAKDGELVWEVRLSRLGAGLSGVLWIECSTGAARILFR